MENVEEAEVGAKEIMEENCVEQNSAENMEQNSAENIEQNLTEITAASEENVESANSNLRRIEEADPLAFGGGSEAARVWKERGMDAEAADKLAVIIADPKCEFYWSRLAKIAFY